MGIFSSIASAVKGQFIDVIEWSDNTSDTIVHKYDMNGKEIMMGAQLTVRESQVAIFVNEGQLADIFVPGRYELQTSNMPILTKLKSWKYGFNSPFKSDVYFVNTKQFLDRKWGTANPVMMRDQDFGMIRLRGFGSYSFRVTDPQAFLQECFGTGKTYRVSDIEEQIKRQVVSSLSDAIAESHIPALDLAANYEELGDHTRQAINGRIAQLGVQVMTFIVENLSLPEDVEKAMDRRTSMGVVGDLNQYTQFQAAEAMRESAGQSGGMAGAGIGMGAGMAMGQMFAQTISGATQQQAAAPQSAPAAQAGGGFCPECGGALTPGAKFCPNCGQKLQAANVCPGCGQPITPGARFCGNCGAKLG